MLGRFKVRSLHYTFIKVTDILLVRKTIVSLKPVLLNRLLIGKHKRIHIHKAFAWLCVVTENAELLALEGACAPIIGQLEFASK